MNPALSVAARVLRDPRFRALLISLGPAAAKFAADLVRQGRWRQLAIVHADAVVDGSFLRVPIDAEPHWIVWSGDQPVACYPPHSGSLEQAVSAVDLAKRQRPADLATRVRRERLTQRADRVRKRLKGAGFSHIGGEVSPARVRRSRGRPE